MTAAPSQIHRQVSGELRSISVLTLSPLAASWGRPLPWPGRRAGSASSRCTPTPTTRRRRARARRPVPAEGVHTVLVCCTGGEEGDILNPAVDTPEVRERPRRGPHGGARPSVGRDHRLRRARTCSATATRACPTPRRTRTPATSPTRRSRRGRRPARARSSARERPQVIITYGDDQQRLPAPRPHPGARDLGARVRARRRPDAVPRARRAVAAAEALLHGLVAGPDAGAARDDARARQREPVRRQVVRAAVRRTDRITTRIDVGDFLTRAGAALLAHATQVDPTSPFWFGLPDDVVREVFPWEEYVLARSLVDTGRPRASSRTISSPAPRPRALRETRASSDRRRPMAKYLSQEWLDEGRKLAEGPARPARRHGQDAVRRHRRPGRRRSSTTGCSRTASSSRRARRDRRRRVHASRSTTTTR